MTVNPDQAIFDAIVAATGMNREIGVMTIRTKKFIDTFNSHRDRKLCTSLDVAQAQPEPRCARCNLPRIQHTYDGAAYGICGGYIAPAQTPDGADGVAAYERGFRDGVFVGSQEKPSE